MRAPMRRRILWGERVLVEDVGDLRIRSGKWERGEGRGGGASTARGQRKHL